MRNLTKIPILAVLLGAMISFMYQETPAQGRKKTNKKPATAAVQAVAPTIQYTVSMSKPATHLLEVEMSLNWASSNGMPEKTDLKMPVWTPGSYLIREYARHVESFSAKDQNGADLAWRKIDKNTWQIDSKNVKEIVARYNVYANELTVRTNELNDEHAFFNNSALLMFPKDQLKTASTVKVVPFGNWKSATGLPKVEGQANTFRAENFDVLYDSPFEVSDFKEISFEVQGKPHRYVVTGDGNYDLEKLAADTAKIVEEGYKIFGDLPYNDYLFILNTRGGGGLEHLNSTALQFNRLGFTTRYKDFLNLVAHEYFHLWNVKRIKPDALGPFDYENENYTKSLWFAEGGTAYYESVLNRRAGIITADEFLTAREAQITALQNRPGRFETSLEDASFDAWIKFYRPDENAINNQISYYDKGELVNFLLDVEIRKASNGAKSLDDVLRALYNDFAKQNKNYTPEDFQEVCETAAGKSLNDFFERYVRGTEEIDYNGILSGIGLEVSDGAAANQTAYLGATLRQDADRLIVVSVPKNTPAYDQGLNANDHIVAVDGSRASQTFLTAYLSEKKPNDKLKLTVFRFDQLREIEIVLSGRARQDFQIKPVANPTDDQRRLYRAFLGADLK